MVTKKQKELQFDMIISDNRFGFYHKNVPSVFITHQLNFQMPYAWATPGFQKYNMPGLRDSVHVGYQTWKEKIIYLVF